LDRLDSLRTSVIHTEYRSWAKSKELSQYLRFPFTAEERAAFCNGHGPVPIVIDHPSYQAVAALPGDTRASLVKDLE
jgi:hypothetical protein